MGGTRLLNNIEPAILEFIWKLGGNEEEKENDEKSEKMKTVDFSSYTPKIIPLKSTWSRFNVDPT